ncbi:MAG: class I SAM-dependent methyltransferase [Sphingobacteriales bacterium]|nr:class I SAM-dependent methyltransferase [Sphingobacteriales bacterium]MBI3717546.1 class I SAM-dependent methyltransferase [Sphingobacteriales bacterium]
MKHQNNKDHWEKIYQYKQPGELSWTEEIPYVSLYQIHKLELPKAAEIIDVGAGTSNLVDYLLKHGYTNITVLDISETAIKKSKARLGSLADNVTWVVNDIIQFKPKKQFEFWHDRATFHFLTNDADIQKYILIAHNAIKENGFLSLGTFSTEGPSECSGLEIKQYNEETLSNVFSLFFEKIWCVQHKHFTPSGTEQNFTLCLFKHLSKTCPS